MRGIKFRAWDKKEHKMISHNHLYRLDCSNEYPFLPLLENRYKDTIFPFDVEIMEYSGLNDMKATEVYEGDVLRRDAYVDMFVEFHDGAFCLVSCNRIQKINWTPTPIGNSDICYREVIGNIYENPELLTT